MTVPKLKAALTELGCETTGLKAVLKARPVEKLDSRACAWSKKIHSCRS